MNYSSRNFSARNDVNGGERKVAVGNFQHGTPTGCREGSAHGGCFQNSKIIDKTSQSQSYGVSSTQDGQAVKVRSEGDIKENEMWDISQKVEACAESSIPIQLDAPYLVTRMGEKSTLQSSCKSTLNVESNVEVTSPQKPRYWAQMVITGIAHGVHDGIAQGVKSDDANVVQTGVALGVDSVAHGIHDESDISAVAATQHR
nr:hypothetical protein CFP56_44551 [Quercus suber]